MNVRVVQTLDLYLRQPSCKHEAPAHELMTPQHAANTRGSKFRTSFSSVLLLGYY